MRQADYAVARSRIPLADFGPYLRTGLWMRPETSGVDVEVKFDPAHDPATGRFTFKNGGDGSWGGGGFTRGGGGSFGGAGASGSGDWGGPRITPSQHNSLFRERAVNPTQLTISKGAAAAGQITAPGQNIERNGYTYRLDATGRTTQVTGTLTVNSAQARSRSAQATAGGSDRLQTDDGGHYVAVRFNGPTDAFNHFAQNANFNRGGYRALESTWASDIKHGKTVWIKIVPYYAGSSRRPSSIGIWFTVNGALQTRSFTNSPKAKHHGQ